MSLMGKLGLFLSGFSLIIMVTAGWILGGWLNLFYVCLFLFFLGLILAVVADYKLYIGFLMMKTTRNGMSVGVSILITLIFCASLSYLTVRFDKTIDITEEKINSLAPQTVKVLENLKEDMFITVFYKGSSGNQKRKIIKQNLKVFKQNSSQIKDRYYDAHVKNKLAQEYLNTVPNKESEDIFVFAEYKGKKILASVPFNEEKLTTAMIKASRRGEKIVYFLSGHGERGSSDSSPGGASELNKALISSSIQSRTWSFVADGPPPKDAGAFLIMGPQSAYLEKEIEHLEKYLEQGGRVLIALDPDKDRSLNPLLKKWGVDYKGNYVMDKVSAFMGLGRFSPLGLHFSTSSPVTQSFQRGAFAVFHIAGNLELIQKNPWSVTELVKTNAKAELVADLNAESSVGRPSSYILGALIEKTDSEDESKEHSHKEAGKQGEDKEHSEDKQAKGMLAVFGDSDFLSNQFLQTRGLNRDLILNTISYLIEESDLVSIRPKKLKATQLILKSSDQMGVVFLAILFPIVFFVISFVIWFRRKEA